MGLRRLAVMVVLVVAGCSFRPETQVTSLHPFSASGDLKDGYRLSSRSYRVDGFEAKMVDASPFGTVPNTYEVGPTALHAGACWADPKHPRNVLCPVTPWSHTLRVLVLPKRPSTPKPKDPQPYGLVLGDGGRCEVRIGGAAGMSSNGWVPAYYCAHETVVTNLNRKAIRTIDRDHRRWYVWVGEPDMRKPLHPKRVFVKRAIFLG